jgi:hypothetical protein
VVLFAGVLFLYCEIATTCTLLVVRVQSNDGHSSRALLALVAMYLTSCYKYCIVVCGLESTASDASILLLAVDCSLNSFGVECCTSTVPVLVVVE